MRNELSPERTAAGRLAAAVSRATTRRGFLARLGRGAAGVFGVGFATAAMGPARFAAATPPCTHDEDEPEACGKKGVKCAFGHTVDCAKFANNHSCAKCVIDANGCPAGTTKGGSWKGCCACKEGGTTGEEFTYYDCCGTAFSMECGFCTGVSSCKAPGYGVSWCGGVGGSPLCTFVESSTTSCTGAPGFP